MPIPELEALIGKEVTVVGTCVIQDEHGVAHNGFSPRGGTGTLKDVVYCEGNVSIVTLMTEKGEEDVHFNTQGTSHIWDICWDIYYNHDCVYTLKGN